MAGNPDGDEPWGEYRRATLGGRKMQLLILAVVLGGAALMTAMMDWVGIETDGVVPLLASLIVPLGVASFLYRKYMR